MESPSLTNGWLSTQGGDSLRNSHARGYDLKLRRTDQALHDTTKSFVENLSKDIRISQHADLLYACKRMEQEKSFWLQPLPGQARPGYLVFLPRQPVVWIDEQFKQSFRIPIRVSFQVYERKSVFIASLDRTDGLLRIEDCWLLAGEMQRGKPFSERWDNVITFFDTKYKPDPVLQQGLRIEAATYESLVTAKSWQQTPNMVFLQGDKSTRRLRVYFKEREEHTPTSASNSQATYNKPNTVRKTTPIAHVNTKPLFVDDENIPESTSTSDSTAIAIPHDEYPDTYNLFIKGVKKGFAAVQDLDLSKQLRSALSKSVKKELCVNILWNEEFKMYEINNIV
jgi:hypothetical protein